MNLECPVCNTLNAEGATVCSRCSTPIEGGGATIVMGPASPDRLEDTVVTAEQTGESWASTNAADKSFSPAEPVSVGTVLGDRYEILAVLGEGGMGTVYKAKDRELDRFLALKVIRPELASNVGILRRFKQEIVLARQITHRNVIRIFDLVVVGGLKFITMEYVAGRDLMSLITENGKFPPPQALAIFKQALQGLQAAHQEDVVHRDLKPHNIMIDAHDRAYLMDFGIARSMEAAGMTRTGVLMGTPDYMSPEQARGEKVDSRSDLFSMGVILFEMLTGELPYKARSAMGKLVKRTQERAPLIASIDPSFPDYITGIVAKCLEIDVDARYQTADDIVADLDRRQVRSRASAGSEGVGASSGELKEGSLLGPRYRIESLLGEGGMGTVYRAHDLELDRTVALKLVRPELASSPASMEKLKQELLLASQISHKHILRIHDLGEAGGKKFISMAYVDGQDLHQRIETQGRLPVDAAVSLAKQILLALEAAHEQGIIHRDLKPQNILVKADGHACVADFGLATSFEAGLSSGTSQEMIGTPRYMAPEQVDSQAVDRRVDIYSFGMIFYEMVTGSLPFASDTVLQAMFEKVTKSPKSPKLLNPELPDDLVAIIMRCIERDPEKRYSNARCVLEDLEKLDHQPVFAPDPVVARPRARALWFWAPVAAIAALFAIFMAIPATRNLLPAGKAVAVASNDILYLAVLPLKVADGDAALSLAADGMVDTLSSRLSQLNNVHLSPPNAAARVDITEPPAKIARTLGAKLLLFGDASRTNGRIELIVSLTEPDTGHRRWTKKFSGVPQDLLTIQDQIYNELIQQLGLNLSGGELALGSNRPTEDMHAYDSYLKGRKLLRGKRDEKTLNAALALFEFATQRDENFALAYTGIADASRYMYDLTKDGKWTTRALGAAERAQQINDNLPEVHFALGSVYIATGKSAEAIAELRRAVALAPNSDEAYRRIGLAYSKSGRKDEAIKAFQKAIDVNPYYWSNQNLLGIALLESGNTESALKAFQRVTEIDPSRSNGWENVAAAYQRTGRWDESVQLYRKALALQPSALAYSNLGAVLYFLGRCEEARQSFEKAAAMTPNESLVIGNLAGSYRCLGQAPKAQEYYDQAITLSLKSLRVNPKDADALAQLGLYYAYKNDMGNALQFVRRARAIDDQNAEVLYHEAGVLALAGQSKPALAALKTALKRGYSAKEAASDPDLKSLRVEPEFLALTTAAK